MLATTRSCQFSSKLDHNVASIHRKQGFPEVPGHSIFQVAQINWITRKWIAELHRRVWGSGMSIGVIGQNIQCLRS
jgi:hypothetical protein